MTAIHDYFDKVIPISYFVGTGGNFLRAFITDAKYNRHQPIKFSQYGNSHSYIEDFHVSSFFNLDDDDNDKLTAILETRPLSDSIEPYYVQTHIIDTNLLTANFNKNIRIVFSESDSLDIFHIFLGKVMNDTMNVNYGNIIDLKVDKLDRFFIAHRMAKHKFAMLTYHKYFHNDNLPNVLCISFKELLYYEPSILLKKLSDFTNIPIIQFNTVNLNKWRELTLQGIKLIQSKI